MFLTVNGKVAASNSITPRELVFSKLGVDATETATTKVISYLSEDLQIESFDWSDPDSGRFLRSSDWLRFRLRRADRTERQGAATRSAVTVKTGQLLGTFRQTLDFQDQPAQGRPSC